MKVSLTHFKQFISDYSRKQRIPDFKGFIYWYQNVRKPNSKLYDTENKDGGIDYIFEDDKTIVLVQSKYSKAGTNDISYFNGVANKWQYSDSFIDWVDNEVDSIKDKKIYKDIYKRRTSKEVTFEFVSLDEINPSLKDRREKAFRNGIDQFKTNYVSASEIYFYFMLDRIGATYTDPLRIEVSESTLNYCDDSKGITTHVCVMKINSLIKELRKLDDIQLVLARNVRVRREMSDVNKDIQKTYLNDTDNFFYGNNGIHFICSDAEIRGKTITLLHPAIINGGQTVRTLFDTDKSTKKPAYVLARVTKIPIELQTKKYYREIIDNIIQRSNNNNPMFLWDLRSNDEIQVKIARELFNRNIYYERKIDEYNQYGYIHASKIDTVLDITDLAIIQAVTSDAIGPVRLKQIGNEPLFRYRRDGGCYEPLFNHVPDNYDEMESKINIYYYLKHARGYLRGLFSDDYQSFPTASLNFMLHFIWHSISDPNKPIINHPIKIYFKRNSKLNPLLKDMQWAIYKIFIKSLKKDGIEQNDFFRRKDCFNKVEKAVLSTNIIKNIKKAIKDEVARQTP